MDWRNSFPAASVIHLPGCGSDHFPSKLELDSSHPSQHGRRRPFKFKAMLLREAGCTRVVQDFWSNLSVLTEHHSLPVKLNACGWSCKNETPIQGALLVVTRIMHVLDNSSMVAQGPRPSQVSFAFHA
ncbi:hypothetical protein Peur_012684 [Populus x canadensis]